MASLTPLPKPQRGEKKRAKEQKLAQLAEYRAQQRALAIQRDNGLCAIAWFLYGRKEKMADVHHIYGRSNGEADTLWKEHYSNLLCVSREEHPGKITTPYGSKSLRYVEYVRNKANIAPINVSFVHTTPIYEMIPELK